MLNIFKIDDTPANKISYYHLLLLLASLPFDMFYSHLVLISYAIHTFIHLKKDRIKLIFDRRVLVLQSVFFITVFSTVYSPDKTGAFNEWGGHLAILLVPVIFCLNPLDLGKYRDKLITAFALVCTAMVVYLYGDALFTIRHYHLPWSTLVMPPFINHNFSEPIGMHATFLSMQLIISLAASIKCVVEEKNRYTRLFWMVCCCVLVAGLVQLSAKSVLIVMLIVVNVFVPWLLLRGKSSKVASAWRNQSFKNSRKTYVIAALSLSAFAVAIILLSSAYRQRFVTGLNDDLAKATDTEIHDGRWARWQVTFSLIEKKPVLGYGAGTEIGLLRDGFFDHKLYDSYLNRLNCHSEYLSIALKSGIIGLLAYLSTVMFGFRTAFKRRDFLFLTFITTIAVVSLSENLLDVDKGAFFYAVFFPFFFFSTQKKAVEAPPRSPEITLIPESDIVLV